MIVTANTYFGMTWEQYQRSVVAPMLALHGILGPGMADGEVIAEVNHGRWIVRCECGGAEKMWEEGVFMCQSCWNGNHRHQYRKVVFPKARKQIEGLLSKRPVPNRNWDRPETLAQLRRDNEAHKEELL